MSSEPFENTSNSLVINSKYDLHALRFSYETLSIINSNRVRVSYIDLAKYDPGFTYKSKIVYLIRKILKISNFYSQIITKIKDKNIPILKIRLTVFETIAATIGSLKILSKKNIDKLSNADQVAINSWISTRCGHTAFKWSIKTKLYAIQAYKAQTQTNLIMKKVLAKNDIKLIYTFNGRFPVDSQVINLCKNFDIAYYLYDGGSLANNNYNKIQYFRSSPHNLTEIKSKIEVYWESGSKIDREIVAQQNLYDLVNGKRVLGSNTSWISGTNEFKHDLDWNNVVVFYSSSDWEQGAISQWQNHAGFRNQFDAAKALYEVCRRRNLLLIIKTHPIIKNYKGKHSNRAELTAWNEFRFSPGVLIFGNNMSGSTYDLLNLAQISLGYKTSLTAQAMFLRKKTIIMSDVAWRDDCLNSNYADNPSEVERKMDMLLSSESIQYNLLPVYKWSYYNAVCGKDMKFSNFSNSKFHILK
jgi:hypothetical protein